MSNKKRTQGNVEENDDGAEMSILDHLKELKSRLVWAILVFIAGFLVSFVFIRELAERMLTLGLEAGFVFVYLSPSELLTAYFKLALIVGLCVSLPVLLFELWGFVAPALSDSEKKYSRWALPAGFVFFVIGAVFAYIVAVPFMVKFLVNYNTSEYITSSISVAQYLNFLTGLVMTFGLVFEMPMLSLLLSVIGVLKPKYMIAVRKYAILIIFILAAIITQPDIFSQIMIGLPMLLLYQISIWVSAGVWKRKEHKEAEEYGETEGE